MQVFLNARHEEFALEDDFFWQFAVEFDDFALVLVKGIVMIWKRLFLRVCRPAGRR